MKVNMTPNPLDVVTIHASQGDTEARQWEFELHNNGELIDTSNVTEQMFFKAYKGGTEQILPENTSTPTTSPFLGDIRYPQGLLTGQEFTYRQSPTEEDGLAKITDIKGNTLVWNQLVGTNVNGLSTIQGTTFTLNSNGSIHVTGTGTGNHFCEWRTNENPSFIMSKGHKYLVKFKGLTTGIVAQVSVSVGQTIYLVNKVNYVGDYDEIFTPTQDGITASLVRFYTTNTFSGTTDIIMQLFDLTQMGLDITDPSDFTSLFPLSYYSYNQGSLLSFNGNGIKTVGKNLFTHSVSALTTNGITFTPQSDGGVKVSGTATANAYFNFYTWGANTHFPTNQALKISGGTSQVRFTFSCRNKDGSGTIDAHDSGNKPTITIPSVDYVIYSALRVLNGVTVNTVIYPMITFANVTDLTYEPYTESVLSLPISTYFPNGMKSAGNVYDELTTSKAIARIKVLDLGTIPVSGWQYYGGRSNFYAVIPDIAVPVNANTKANAKCKIGVPITWNEMLANQNENGTYAVTQVGTEKRFYIKNTNYSTVTDFLQYVNGIYLYYELATPTETSFKTASLVTENAEIPLSNEDGTLIGKCTEQLSENPGFFDAKIKLSDSDGECYSNKIQLHVERSPQ